MPDKKERMDKLDETIIYILNDESSVPAAAVKGLHQC